MSNDINDKDNQDENIVNQEKKEHNHGSWDSTQQNSDGSYNYKYAYSEKPKKKRTSTKTVVGIVMVAFFGLPLLFSSILGIGVLTNKNLREQLFGASNKTEQQQNIDNNEDDTPIISSVLPPVKNTSTGELTIPDITKKVRPSVVGIVINVTSRGQIQNGSGSGFIIREDGYIATNAHVVDSATKIQVILFSGKEYTATLVGKDTKTDIAVVKIDEKGLTVADMGQSETLQDGELAVVIGNPFGLELAGTVTSGIISATGRKINESNIGYLQTDAAISPGNSGSPLVNRFGQIIGITTAKYTFTASEGLGFAIPITEARDIMNQLIQVGYIKNRPILGITGIEIDSVTANVYQMPQGIYIQTVQPGTDIANKLKPQDVITAINDIKISTISELNAEKDKFKAGQSVKLTIYRSGSSMDVNVTLTEEKPNNG